MSEPLQPAVRKIRRSAHAQLFGTGALNPRCSIIVAHPADEIVGAGCLISKLVDVSILHVTDGAPRCDSPLPEDFSDWSDYARARKSECLSALAIANVPEDRVVDLAVPDHTASERLAELTRTIATFIQQSGADIVVTHPYEGGHPDHDATAFATHAALRLVSQNGFRPPVLFEMALRPSDDGKKKVAEFLPGSDKEMTTLLLDERARSLKNQMFECIQTHRECLQNSPLSAEKFRQPNSYDFSRPPQAGQALL